MTTYREKLTDQQQTTLRQSGLISSQEVAFISGDLLIAENVVTNDRRVLGETNLLVESSNKRVLKG